MAKAAGETQKANHAWAAIQDFDFTKTLAGGERGAKAMAEFQEHCIARTAMLNRAIADFFEERLSHDQETVRKLAACKSAQDTMAVWADFFELASRQYAEGFRTFATMGIDQTREVVEDVQDGVDKTVQSLKSGSRSG